MNLLIVEPLCSGYSHVPHNSGFLTTALLAFPDNKTTFFAEKQHLELVQQHLEVRKSYVIDRIKWENLDIFDQALHSIWYQRFLTLSKALRQAQLNGNEAIIFTSMDGIGLFALKILLLSRFRNLKTMCIMHSVMANITAPTPFLKSWLFRQLLLRGNYHLRLKYIVLAPSIHRTAIKLLPCLAPSLAYIDHPYLFGNLDNEGGNRSKPNEQVVFGFIGGNTLIIKGFHLLKQLAQDVTQRVSGNRCAFTVSGGRTEIADGPGIITQPYLSQQEYISWIQSLDYLIFPYSSRAYLLRASGCVLDAFEYLKPCVFLRIPLFEDYYKRMGNIGYLCDTYEQLREQVINLTQNFDMDKYLMQRQAILAGREIFTPRQLAPQLRQIIETL